MRALKLLLGLFVIAGVAHAAPDISGTSPAAWAIQVDPAVQKTVSVTFNEPMRPGFSAFAGRSSVLPELNLEPAITDDRKTFEIKTTLRPGKVYVFALNEKNIPGIGFQNDRGASLPAKYLVFQTLGTPMDADTPPHVVAGNSGTVDVSKNPPISIRFDRAMNPKRHGLQLFENGQAIDLTGYKFNYSLDRRTFELFYPLKPWREYTLQLNERYDVGFSSIQRIPLWPARYSFRTVIPESR